MKKLFLIINSIVFAFLVSCSNDFSDNVFGEDSSTRLTKSIDAYHTLLQSAPEGWALEYWPGGTTQSYGGYTYTLKFTADEVTAMLDTEGTTVSATSTYDITRNGGATLSFDTYNRLLHYFANPSSGLYQARQGDYEFLLMSHTDDEIVLQGKKFKSKMRLYKIKNSTTAFIEEVVDVVKYIEERGIFSFQIKGKDLEFATNERTITYNYDLNGATGSKMIPYIFTPTGIKTYEPVTIDGVTFQELTLDKTTNTLKNSEGSVVLTLAQLLPIDFVKKIWRTIVVENNVSTSFKTVFDQIKQTNDTKYVGETLRVTVDFGLTREYTTGITFFSYSNPTLTRGYRVVKRMSFQATDVLNEVIIKIGGDGSNWRAYTHLLPMVEFVDRNSPYNIEVDNANPNQVKLTSKNNPDVWFNLINE